jgi:hypothetical protein
MINAAGGINSVDIIENKAFVFDFSDTVNDGNSNTAEKDANGIGYYGWGWNISSYTDGETTNRALGGNNQTGNSWSTGGGYRIHTKKADGTYGFYALAPSSRYVVSFKIRVFSSPVSVGGSDAKNTTYVNLGYNSNYNPNMAGMAANFINWMNTSIPVMIPAMATPVSPLWTYLLASSSSPAPRLMLKLAAVPIPNSMLIPVVSVTVGKATFVAALPSIPTTWPIKIWSVILYAAPTSILITDGIA